MNEPFITFEAPCRGRQHSIVLPDAEITLRGNAEGLRDLRAKIDAALAGEANQTVAVGDYETIRVQLDASGR